jgi:hypothetical protein
MALGKKTGGRRAGTPNKRTAEVTERLEALGCDPIEGMAVLAMDPANSPDLRGRMFAELAQYVAPKRRATEISAADQQRVVFNLNVGRQADAALDAVDAPVAA